MDERFIFILLFFILMFIFAEENQPDFIFLTKGTKTHHRINYLNTDQCMRRPGQEEIGSYGLVFKRQRGYLCDMILICYPSQLLANNTLDGIITPIPYRLSKAKQNNITKLCESKRKEYCENLEGSYEYYIMCTLGMGASTTWHGIELSTEYFKKDEKNGYFSTTISLSITDQKYYLYDTPFFNIEFGQKEDIFTRIRINDREKYIKKNVTFPDENLVNEYLSKIGKGAFLYKYTGLWALGLDLLPTPAQQFLHLFVYIGCGCPTDVWFKTPTISSSLVPKRPANVLTVKNKDCKKRYTNHSKFSLGNITGTDNKFINFTVWTDKEVKEGTSIKLISKGGITIFEVYIFPDKIKLWSSVEEIREKNMSNIEAIVDITIVLNRYYSLIKVDRKAINNRFVKKIWPKNWWDGHDLIDVEMIINGDVILVSPINVRIMSEEEITKIPGITQKVPYSAAVGRSISKSIGFDAYCIVNKNASKFSIKLLHGVYEENAYIGHTVIALTVNFTKNNLTIYSTKDDKSNSTGNYFPYRSLQQNKTKIFEKGKPFELYINITDKPYTSIDVNIFVNNNSIETRTIELPIWMIQYIHMDGDIQLFSIYIKEKDLLEPPHLKFVKQVDELKSYGLITCFEASVFPRAQMELNNAYNFQIFMNYDSLIPERDYIERILNLNFVFETGKYEFNKNKTHFKYKEGSDSSLLLRTYFNQSWEYIENRKNPIRAGMYIHVIISATEHYYEIIFVNGGDFLYYLHRYPAWAVNYIVINGTVGGVKFDTQKCDVFKNILPKFKLKTNTYKFRKILKKGSELVIKFFTPIPFNKSIIIYFFHGAIEWNEKIGHTVLALNITNNCTKINSYTNGKWLYGVNGTIAGCKHNLLENQKVRASIKIEGSYDFKTTLETKDDVFTLNGTIKIPFSTVQYIQVIGHDEMKNVTFTMKYNHNDL